MKGRKRHLSLLIGLVLLLFCPTIACVNLFPPPVRPSRGFSVGVDFIPSKTIYLPGEKIEIELILTNNSTEPVTVTFPPKVSILVPELVPDPLAESSTVMHIFPAGIERRQLAVGETVTYKLVWDQKDENGKQASPGWYFIEETLSLRKETPPAMDWEAGGQTGLFLIQYPQGAMQKTMELNQSQTINGFPLTVDENKKWVHLVLTLERVELIEKGASFFALASSPDNPVPGYDNPEWRSGFINAQYVIDGVIKNPRGAGMRFIDNGIELSWGGDDNYLDPVPRDARQLAFIITRFGDWQGRLEFQIPLQ